MAIETRFIPHALRVIGEAVVEIIGMTGLHVRREGLSKRLAGRARGRLRALEQMLHRVIMLMAIGLSKEGFVFKGVPPRIRYLGGPASPARQPAPKARRISAPRVPCLPPAFGAGRHVDFATLPAGHRGKRVSLVRLIKRIQVLQAVLANPAPQARRLARRFAKLAARRAPLPTPPPDIPIRRARAELSLIAGALPMELSRAMAPWQNSS